MANKDVNIITQDARTRIRENVGMWIGTNENPNALLTEAFGNSLDEHLAGFGSVIEVGIDDGGIVKVTDHGRGFEINKKRDDGKTVLEASFDTILTSGKYLDDGSYTGSIGQNGIGSKTICFTSEWLNVDTWRNGLYESISFEKGILKKHSHGKTSLPGSGTTIEYLPDKEIFDTIKTDANYFRRFFNDICYICNDLTIILNGDEVIHHNSIDEAISPEDDMITPHFVLTKDDINIAFTYTTSDVCIIRSFANCGAFDSGVPITQIKSTLTRVFNKFAREQGLLKDKDKNLSGTSLQEGLDMIFNISSNHIIFDSQSKNTISKVDLTNQMTEFTEALVLYLDTYPDVGKAIVEKALLAKRAAEAAKKARANVKAKSKKNSSLRMPTTLVDCHCKDRSKAELFIVEGKAASGGLIAARNSTYQSIYSVRGMMLSVLKTKPENIIKNKEINNLLTALGLDYNSKNCKCKYDKSKLRYGKIIAAADGDEPGAAIRNLMFNIFWYICPELIINGHVYTSMPPLFRVITKKNEYIYLKDVAALEDYKSKHQKDIQSIGREKGLGEMDSDELEAALLNPETRNISCLTVSDYDKTDRMFQDLYGRKVEPRVRFLADHLEEANVE